MKSFYTELIDINGFELAILLLFLIFASVNVLDTRLKQAELRGESNPQIMPKFVITFIVLQYVSLAILVFINWKLALVAFVLKFILSVLPVMELLGSLIAKPFHKNEE